MKDTVEKAPLQPMALKTISPNYTNAPDIKEMAHRL